MHSKGFHESIRVTGEGPRFFGIFPAIPSCAAWYCDAPGKHFLTSTDAKPVFALSLSQMSLTGSAGFGFATAPATRATASLTQLCNDCHTPHCNTCLFRRFSKPLPRRLALATWRAVSCCCNTFFGCRCCCSNNCQLWNGRITFWQWRPKRQLSLSLGSTTMWSWIWITCLLISCSSLN